MASVKYTAFVSEIRGKVNGSVFSKNRAGNYIRTKVTPVNPQSTAQQLQRGQLSQMSQAWRGLTQEQRDGWANYASQVPYSDIYGDVKFLSGQMMFVKTNLNLLKVGAATIDNAPTPGDVPQLGITSLTAAADTTPAESILSLVTTITGTDTGVTMAIYATPPVGPGKSFVKNQFRLIGTNTTTAGAKNLLTPYLAKFGNLIAGNKVFVRIQAVVVATGQVSTPLEVMAIATVNP